jgi:hypothetical protein
MIVMCLHTKFHMPVSSEPLVIAVKPKTKYRFHAAAMLLFYILQKKLL